MEIDLGIYPSAEMFLLILFDEWDRFYSKQIDIIIITRTSTT